MPVTMSMVDTSIGVESEEYREDVVDQANEESKKDDIMPSFSLGLGLSQVNVQFL